MNKDTQLEHIKIGQLLMKEGKYFFIKDGVKGWCNSIDDAKVFGKKIEMGMVEYYLELEDFNIDKIELIPVKKVTQYQLGEF